MIGCASCGRELARLSTCCATWAGSAMSPYRVMAAISAGKMARNAKNATPAASIDTLSSLLSLNARRVICHQPRAGIWVGAWAWPPGGRSVVVGTAVVLLAAAVRMSSAGG